jgi:HSP20 family protein
VLDKEIKMTSKYRPLSLIGELQREFGNLFLNESIANFDTEQWAPAVDIVDQANQYVIKADLPGVRAEDIDVTLENGVVTIKGVREEEKKEENKNFKRTERFSGSFLRRFTLPEAADLENIKAKTKNGVLELSIPKNESKKSKRIQIKVDK